jgi:hypothetical protein
MNSVKPQAIYGRELTLEASSMDDQLALRQGGVTPNTGLKDDMQEAGTGTPTATSHDTGYLRVFVFALFFSSAASRA